MGFIFQKKKYRDKSNRREQKGIEMILEGIKSAQNPNQLPY